MERKYSTEAEEAWTSTFDAKARAFAAVMQGRDPVPELEEYYSHLERAAKLDPAGISRYNCFYQRKLEEYSTR